MTKRKGWVDVDLDGLAALIEDRGKVFLLHELTSNSWDTDTTKVEVSIRKIPGSPYVSLTVKDEHPEGFKDLTHAFTMYASSDKKDQPTTRGRFNVGDKLVLAMCKEAEIVTTTGTVTFGPEGRARTNKKTAAGSIFSATIKMTTQELEEAIQDFRKVIPPPGKETYLNGDLIPVRTAIASFWATLPTVLADASGVLRKTARQTVVNVYEPLPGEKPAIYELGIPVVETGDKYHLDIQQKVPLTVDRDNVPPSYLKALRALVLNEVHDRLTETEANSVWVTEALGSDKVAHDTVKSVIETRFGEKAAIYDPSDREANNALVSRGYTIVAGGSLPADVWAKVKEAEALKPSGVLAPTPKPYDPDGTGRTTLVPEADWTEDQRKTAALTKGLAQRLLGVSVDVRMVKAGTNFAACYGRRGIMRGSLDFNLTVLKPSWFGGDLAAKLDLIVHELGHHEESNHLSESYHKAITKLAGKMAVLALTEPAVFR